MLHVNNYTITGNLTRDPQVRFVGERAVANFGIANNRRFKTADGAMREEVLFLDVEVWGRVAEIVGQYLVKGSPVFIEGRLKMSPYEKDGVKHSRMVLVANDVQFLESKEAGEARMRKASGADQGGAPQDAAMEDQAPAEAPVPAPARRPATAGAAPAPVAPAQRSATGTPASRPLPPPRRPAPAVRGGDEPPF